ncbi:ral guanine nucleotide dissociation stimulator-like 3 isoform X3 [Paroedura picta]|uniref:ral guanine nucleotide dissociation stimulator-like 3 isoform X3 n=1 Tax=Paroedura picta TaxID=143630 RepID=UPI0040576FDF
MASKAEGWGDPVLVSWGVLTRPSSSPPQAPCYFSAPPPGPGSGGNGLREGKCLSPDTDTSPLLLPSAPGCAWPGQAFGDSGGRPPRPALLSGAAGPLQRLFSSLGTLVPPPSQGLSPGGGARSAPPSGGRLFLRPGAAPSLPQLLPPPPWGQRRRSAVKGPAGWAKPSWPWWTPPCRGAPSSTTAPARGGCSERPPSRPWCAGCRPPGQKATGPTSPASWPPIRPSPPGNRAVLPVLELWLQGHAEDFWEPPEHPSLQRALSFLHQVAPRAPTCALAEGLLQALRKQEEEEEEQACGGRDAAESDTGAETPGVGLPQVLSEVAGLRAGKAFPALLSFAVEEVAEQLTLMDAELFQAVRPFHCLGCVWSQRDKKDKQHEAPSVRATVSQFNAVASCVVTSLLEDLTLRVPQRAHLLEKWIDIAQHCRSWRNFSSLYAILSALQSNPIYRLKRTWAAVNRAARSSFHKLSEIFSEDHNHLNCREILLQDGGPLSPRDGCSPSQAPAGTSPELNPQGRPLPPTVPYLGTFLTDLIMLDTALPDLVEGGLINFEKRRKEAESLAVIRQLQESCRGYSLSPNPSFRMAFQGQQRLSEEQSLLLGSDAPATLPSPARAGASLPGSFGSLPSGEGLGLSCCPTWEVPPGKASPLEGGGEGCPRPAPLGLPRQSQLTRPPSPSPAPESAPPLLPSKQSRTESRIIRVSLDQGHGNLYRSIVITSQDKTAAVVRRALRKHNLGEASPHNYRLLQRLGDGQELLIPSSANAFYAMNPARPWDFLLCHEEEAALPGGRATHPSTPTPHPGSPTPLPAPSGAVASSCSRASPPCRPRVAPHGPPLPHDHPALEPSASRS